MLHFKFEARRRPHQFLFEVALEILPKLRVVVGALLAPIPLSSRCLEDRSGDLEPLDDLRFLGDAELPFSVGLRDGANEEPEKKAESERVRWTQGVGFCDSCEQDPREALIAGD